MVIMYPRCADTKISNIWISIKYWAHNRTSAIPSSWEKGSVENVIGLVRIYLSKGTNFATITKERLQQVENLINERPRKCLGYKTSNEGFTSNVALHC